MQKRVVRLTLLALLLGSGIGAAVAAWDINTQMRATASAHENVSSELDVLLTTLADISATQRAYVAPGQAAEPAFEKAASLVQSLSPRLETIRPVLRSREADGLLQEFGEATASLVEADRTAREYVETEQQLWAVELIFGKANETLARMTQSLTMLELAESAAARSEAAANSQTLWRVIGGTALFWMLGLILLAPGAKASAPAHAVPPSTEPARETSEVEATSAPAVDLPAAAGVCVAISRLTSADELPDLLARAANAFDASGIIIWMGAGEELFPAAFHGYDPRTIARLGPIGRGADNATAAAWRTGEVKSVRGDMMSNGAIVAPMFGGASCIGVLAAEVRHGREADPATRAVTAMLAAQLATVVSAWPAASTAEPAATPENPRLREASGI
jgi:hypothetical protein